MQSLIKTSIPACYRSCAVSLESYRGHSGKKGHEGVSDPQARCKDGAMGRLVATLAHAGLWGIYIITPNYIIVPGETNIYACVHTYTHTQSCTDSHALHFTFLIRINIFKFRKSKCILQSRSRWVYREISFIVRYRKWPEAEHSHFLDERTRGSEIMDMFAGIETSVQLMFFLNPKFTNIIQVTLK